MSHGLSKEIQERTLALIRNLFARAANSADDAGEFDEWALTPNESTPRREDEWEDGGETWSAPAQDE